MTSIVEGQISVSKFGKGIDINGKDSSYHVNFSFRFQNLAQVSWFDAADGGDTNTEVAFLIRRARLKFSGFAFDPDLKFKLELGLSNRDIGAENIDDFSNGAKLILDAYVDYYMGSGFALRFGQFKLPGNRERVISSGDLQFVDRSRLNSRYNIDRDFGLMLKHKFNLSDQFIIKEFAVVSQGEGRNVTSGYHGGLDYTFRVEFFPFGEFASKGDYVGSAIKYEDSPKLSIGLTYDINKKANRYRGQLGSFIPREGRDGAKDLKTFFADLMLKYKRTSVMIEYVDKTVPGNDPRVVIDNSDFGTYYIGTGLNLQAGFIFTNNIELAARYTVINPNVNVSVDEDQYTLGLSKYFSGHKLKIQTDATMIKKIDSDNQYMLRTQFDIHF
jgi:hypothetical protein